MLPELVKRNLFFTAETCDIVTYTPRFEWTLVGGEGTVIVKSDHTNDSDKFQSNLIFGKFETCIF